MTTFTEVLPARKSSANSAINWRPVTDDGFVVGVLTIHTDTASVAYTVSEFSTGWTDRGFTLRKVTPGTDTENPNYNVCCRPGAPAVTSCDCKGHTRFLHCKHADGINALIENGWL